MLGAEPVAENAEGDAPAHAGETFDAVDRHRGERREAARHGVRHGVEDRPGVRRAAAEEGEREDREGRGDEGFAQRHRSLRQCLLAAQAARRLLRRRPAHEERRGNERRPHQHGEHGLRGSPVHARDQPRRERRHGHRCHPHADRHERHGEPAMLADPAHDRGDHRREEAADGDADQEAEGELELQRRLRAAGEEETQSEQHRAGQHDEARADPVAERAPAEARGAHGEEADRHRRRYASDRPAGVLRNRPQEDGQREHGADRNAAQQATRRDDHPAIAGIGHPCRAFRAVPRCRSGAGAWLTPKGRASGAGPEIRLHYFCRRCLGAD